jgi:ABC-2 type transport system permease protein
MTRGSFAVLLRKELREQTRSYRLLVVGLLFVFFGLASPLLAKFTPEIVKMASVGQNIVIEIPEPTAADAVAQYVKNLSQIALLVLIFLSMGAVVAEKERGTAAFVLVKPASRLGFLAAKLAVSWAIVFGAVILSGLCAYGYTAALFESPSVAGFVLANVALLLHLLTFVTTTFFFSAVARSQAVAGVLSFLAWVVLASLGGLGYATEFLPGRLLSAAMASAAGSPLPWEPLVGSAAIIALAFFGAVLAFRRWEP